MRLISTLLAAAIAAGTGTPGEMLRLNTAFAGRADITGDLQAHAAIIAGSLRTAQDLRDGYAIAVAQGQGETAVQAMEAGLEATLESTLQALIPTAPAILNAIHDAVGIRLPKVPATPDRIRAAILAKESSK